MHKPIILITTLIYTLAGLYSMYLASLQIFVYISNKKLGHVESFRLSALYIISSIGFGLLSFIGYKMLTRTRYEIFLKMFFYFPIALLLLYGIWILIILIGSGGRWN